MSEYAISTLFASPGLDFMYISASAPDAPPFSVTTIGCFIRLFFWIAACIMRAIWSDAPPAPAATTISTGFVGCQSAAIAAAGATAAAASETISGNERVRLEKLRIDCIMTPPENEYLASVLKICLALVYQPD